MTLITLKEWAEREGIALRTARQKAQSGLLETAKKAGRDWLIEEDEPNIDNRRQGKSRRWTEK